MRPSVCARCQNDDESASGSVIWIDTTLAMDWNYAFGIMQMECHLG